MEDFFKENKYTNVENLFLVYKCIKLTKPVLQKKKSPPAYEQTDRLTREQVRVLDSNALLDWAKTIVNKSWIFEMVALYTNDYVLRYSLHWCLARPGQVHPVVNSLGPMHCN